MNSGDGLTRAVLEELIEVGQDERVAALSRLNVLDTPMEDAFDEIAILAAKICKTEMAAVTLIDVNRQWFKAAINLPVRETPISESFCTHVVALNDPLIINDATESPAFSDNLLVTGDLGVRFYGGMPIREPGGVPVGALCVIGRLIKPSGLDAMQHRALRALAGQVERLLEMRALLIRRDQQVTAQRALAFRLNDALQKDFLTGLPNRSAFQKALREAIERQRGEGGRVALLLLDLDHFKQINDWLGHDAGDEVLKDFSTKLRNVVRDEDTVARLGGDEFAIIIHVTDDDDQIASAVKSITGRLADPVQYQGRTIAYRQSIGIALYPDHASNEVDLFRHSDLALIEAKSLRGAVVSFNSRMLKKLNSHMEFLEEASVALNEQRVTAFYQPKIDLRSGRVIGFEALARYHRPGVAAEHPRMFEALFQDAKLSRSATDQITVKIFADIRRWIADDINFGHVAINASTYDFSDDNFGERLIRLLDESNVSASKIQIEITETVLLDRGQSHVKRALNLLNEAGVKIALDDFGTGHASLIHLKSFPVHFLKIDRSFIKKVTRDHDDAVIVKAMIELGHGLGIEIVAEGIETSEQLRTIIANGCDMGQGYLFSKAVPSNEVDILTQRKMRLK
ncbi:EAL domain-containing protein (plasmid) [Polymorphobacter sp. PAMC 29334]|uniref:putative bifunctional diguanylate cyclase/phosphodiesterase n=1 Tax=Polymorphobacter sp. PAMC 29334 TaxID=2862331 RepID=UPI001C79929A|nr:EAL domain-containing protein [Polymorphobacter sp. PAMC 29334]QYE37068.1 EAL domain-containing protein [Polymorphobacter sp. PAMC 29334]